MTIPNNIEKKLDNLPSSPGVYLMKDSRGTILYGSEVTPSMSRAVEETNRRRLMQAEYNRKHGITPESIRKEIHNILDSVYESDYVTVPTVEEKIVEYKTVEELDHSIAGLEQQMKEAAANLEFEKAARLRDEIRDLKEQRLEIY